MNMTMEFASIKLAVFSGTIAIKLNDGKTIIDCTCMINKEGCSKSKQTQK